MSWGPKVDLACLAVMMFCCWGACVSEALWKLNHTESIGLGNKMEQGNRSI